MDLIDIPFKAEYFDTEFIDSGEKNSGEVSENGDREDNSEEQTSDTKSIMGMDVRTGKSIYGSKKETKPPRVDRYRDPAVSDSRVFGSYSSPNPVADAYRSESSDTSNGYTTLRISMKRRRIGFRKPRR